MQMYFDFTKDATRASILNQLRAKIDDAAWAAITTEAMKAGVPKGHHHGIVEVRQTIDSLRVSRKVKEDLLGVYEILAKAEAQVHGGMSMGIGYALTEELLYNEKGRPLNANLLDFKIPTAMDCPDYHVEFLEMDDPMGPYGNKALGEPPAIPVAPAIRNAILHATGVSMKEIPMTQQKLVAAFKEAGLI